MHLKERMVAEQEHSVKISKVRAVVDPVTKVENDGQNAQVKPPPGENALANQAAS
jgi:hypothetical protein